MKDFINIRDLSAAQMLALLQRARSDKALFKAGKLPAALHGKTLGMIFEKPSLRTRVSFETAMTHLGGHAIYLTNADIGLGSREAIQDIARVLGRMCDGIMARTFSHSFVEQMARHAPVPVINGLTDYSHPCQAMADFMTLQEIFGEVKGRSLAFIGDGNNVARSLAIGCAKLEMTFVLACPKGYELDGELVAGARSVGGESCFQTIHDPKQAVLKADCIYTDTWVSMGQEAQKAKRVKDFAGYQINAGLLKLAPAHAVVLHCLPAYRDYEITDEAFEAHACSILEEAENRLHFQRSLLNVLMAEGGIL